MNWAAKGQWRDLAAIGAACQRVARIDQDIEMNEHRIVVSLESPPDRERLVSSILVDDAQLAEINSEGDALMIEVYSRPNGQPWVLKYSELMDALIKAKGRLAARDQSSDSS